MRRRFFFVPLFVLIAACGGGNGSSTPPLAATPTPISVLTTGNQLIVTWSGVGHSRTPAAQLRARLGLIYTSNISGEPLALAAAPACGSACDPVATFYTAASASANQANVYVSEVNAAGTPIPVISPQVSANAAIASVVAQPTAQPATTDTYLVAATAKSGTLDSLSIATSDVGGLLRLVVYSTITLQEPRANGSVFVDSSPQYLFTTNGGATKSSPGSAYDIGISSRSTGAVVSFPNGYALVADTVPFSEVGPITTFNPVGTSLSFTALQTASMSNYIVVKDTDGSYAKLLFSKSECQTIAQPCDDVAAILGEYQVALPGGIFPW